MQSGVFSLGDFLFSPPRPDRLAFSLKGTAHKPRNQDSELDSFFPPSALSLVVSLLEEHEFPFQHS